MEFLAGGQKFRDCSQWPGEPREGLELVGPRDPETLLAEGQKFRFWWVGGFWILRGLG